MLKYQVIRKEKDNIPGFRDSFEQVEAAFESRKDAEEYLSKCESRSTYHEGYGAGSGSVDITYFIVKVED